jgi:hypothetical protein
VNPGNAGSRGVHLSPVANFKFNYLEYHPALDNVGFRCQIGRNIEASDPRGSGHTPDASLSTHDACIEALPFGLTAFV